MNFDDVGSYIDLELDLSSFLTANQIMCSSCSPWSIENQIPNHKSLLYTYS